MLGAQSVALNHVALLKPLYCLEKNLILNQISMLLDCFLQIEHVDIRSNETCIN